MTHEVLLGESATLRHLPMDSQARPVRITSATYGIVDLRKAIDDADRELVAPGTAAVLGSEATTLASSAGPSSGYAQRLLVASVAGFVVGRRYAIQAEAGHTEVFRVAALDSTTNTIHTQHPIVSEFATGDDVLAVELEATFPVVDEDTALESYPGDYQVTWSYTLPDGRDVVAPEMVRIRRYSTTPWATPEDLERRYGGLATRRANESWRITDALFAATENVQVELLAMGLDPELYRASLVGKVLVTLSALEIICRGFHGEQDIADAERFHASYKSMLNGMLTRQPPKGSLVVDAKTDTRDDSHRPPRGWVVG